jgi:hypothetical protein
MKEILYRGSWLQKGSYAFELYFDKDDPGHKKLDKHMKDLDQKDKDLKEKYNAK